MGEAENLWFSSSRSRREILLHALRSFANEDFSVRLPGDLDGVDEAFIQAFNAAAETNERLARQIRRLEKRLKAAERQVQESAGEQSDPSVSPAPPAPSTLSARFKSEFLANMSKELRTPLNSMLTLAKLLADNTDNNLSSKQIDYAQTIYSAGTDLLSLLDDIIDLDRIESGNVTLHVEAETFSDLRDKLFLAFHHVAQGKGLQFEIELAAGLPPAIHTDIKRLQQILGNLLSNAFKFTGRGRVGLRIAPAAASGFGIGQRVVFTVTDTGIGIPEDKQHIILEAFDPADGASQAAYTGAGLGLSICGELTRLLGGEIVVDSVIGEGSSFTLTLPVSCESVADDADGVLHSPVLPENEATPIRRETYYGRKSRRTDDGVVLIAEGDPRFAAVMLGLVREGGHQGVVAADSATLGILLRELKPDAILLGANLRDVDGWSVLNQLKHDPETRLLPVHMTYVQQRANRCLQIVGSPSMAVYEELVLPIRILAQLGVVAGRDVRRILAAIGPDSPAFDWVEAWRLGGVEVTVVESGARIVAALENASYDGVIIGSALGDMSVIELLRRLLVSETPNELPVALLGRMALAADGMDDGDLEIAILRHRDRLEKILDEASAFLERSIGRLPNPREETPGRRHRTNTDLSGKNALLIDRDMRNIYAMTGALEQHGMQVVHAESAAESLDALRRAPDIDVVIVDCMLPGDGDDAIRLIRGQEGFSTLPIIALTAKSGQGEHERCLHAGASDCINKPVNIEHLLSLLRVWLVQHGNSSC